MARSLEDKEEAGSCEPRLFKFKRLLLQVSPIDEEKELPAPLTLS